MDDPLSTYKRFAAARLSQLTPDGVSAVKDLENLLRRYERESAILQRSIASTLAQAPDWFTRLGERGGIAELEARLNANVPPELQLFYRFPAFACSLHSRDTDIFLNEYSDCTRPPAVRLCGIDHLIIAEFPCAECVQAVALGSDSPRVEWGYDGAAQPDVNVGPVYFADWVTKLASITLDEMKGIHRNPESKSTKTRGFWRSFLFPNASIDYDSQ